MGQGRMTGPPVAIDGRSLYHFLSSPKFFQALPPTLEDWVAEAREARRKVAVLAQEERDCTSCSAFSEHIAPLVLKLAARLAEMHKIDPRVTDPLVGFVADRQGYLPKYVLMYYKDSKGKVTPFKF